MTPAALCIDSVSGQRRSAYLGQYRNREGPAKFCVSRNQWRRSNLVVFFYLCSGTTWSLGTEVNEGSVQGGPIKTELLLHGLSTN